jgi:2-polyprenyl-6-methoxyphenol hydroxylase-like FAD-dependent oxidoreductase
MNMLNSSMPSKTKRHAVVLGGSIAGLLATRVLSDHFEQITLIERDCILGNASHHKGVPQARHVHVLLARGLEIVTQLFPDLADELKAQGATELDFGADVGWYQLGDYKCQFNSGMNVLCQSRLLLEAQIRQRVVALINVTILSEYTMIGLKSTPDRKSITGITFHRNGAAEQNESLDADLVIDAMGRGSHSSQWLEELGYEKPKVSQVTAEIGYTSRIYPRKPDDLGGMKGFILSPTPPHEKRGGVVSPIEGDRWMVTLMGYLGEHAPTDERGFLNFAQSLPTSDIYDLISQTQALSSPIPHRFRSSLRCHYEKLSRYAEGYLVLGDALCSFNPIFGQGMSVAAIEAQVLDACLKTSPEDLTDLPKHFFRKTAQVINAPWQMVTGEDFRYPEVIGKRSLNISALNWYISKVYRATHRDTIVYGAFIQVMHLVRSPQALFHPKILLRVLKASWLSELAAIQTIGGKPRV